MQNLKPMKPSFTLLSALLVVLMITPPLWAQNIVATEKPIQNPSQGIDQMPGFPLELGPWVPDSFSRGVILADLDGDQDLELVYPHPICTSDNWICNQGRVSAWDHEGNPLPGFPVAVEGTVDVPASVADLDGDGEQEIVLITLDVMIDKSRLYIIDRQGNLRDGFPMLLDMSYGYTTLYDLDLDGQKEIIFGSRSRLMVASIDGTLWGGSWPVDLWPVTHDTLCGLTGALSVGDIDGDGLPEIAAVTDTSVVLVRADGSIASGWPKTFPLHAAPLGSYSLLADFDQDLDLEVVVVRIIDRPGEESYVEIYVLQHDGQTLPAWPQQVVSAEIEAHLLISAPLITDLENDGQLEIVMAVGHESQPVPQYPPLGQKVYAWDDAGVLKKGFPYYQGAGNGPGWIQVITAVDADGDGLMELYMDSVRGGRDGKGGYIFGIDAQARNLPGFPLRPDGITMPSGAIIGDVDQDGDYELAAACFAGNLMIFLYDIPTSYSSTEMSWPTFHADNDRSGLFKRRYRDWRFVRAGTRIGSGR